MLPAEHGRRPRNLTAKKVHDLLVEQAPLVAPSQSQLYRISWGQAAADIVLVHELAGLFGVSPQSFLLPNRTDLGGALAAPATSASSRLITPTCSAPNRQYRPALRWPGIPAVLGASRSARCRATSGGPGALRCADGGKDTPAVVGELHRASAFSPNEELKPQFGFDSLNLEY